MVPTTYAQEGFRTVSAADIASHPPEKRPLDRTRSDYQITERGAHHQVWERVETVTDLNGQEEEVVRSYTELGANLNYWDSQASAWKESREVIEPIAGGAIARQGGQQVKFASDLNVEGSVKILNSDGSRAHASVIGLVLRGLRSDRKVVLGTVQASRGKIVPPNRVVYNDAFDGIRADVLYVYKKSGVIQDVILRERIGPPASYGFDPTEPVALEVVTEFFEGADPERVIRVSRETEAADARAGGNSRLQDEDLKLGSMRFAEGVAFPTDIGPEFESESIRVSKRWESSDDRKLLIEAVEYHAIKDEVDQLSNSSRSPLQAVETSGSVTTVLDVNLEEGESRSAPLNTTTDDPLATAGYVIDYTTIDSPSSYVDYVFESGKTYHMKHWLSFHGVTTFEGGAVLKHSDASSTSVLNIYGDVDFKTSEFSPAIFTSMHDDSIGQKINNSSGNPSAGFPSSTAYASTSIRLIGTTGQVIRNVQIRYAYIGLRCDNGSGHTFQNVQVSDCYRPLLATSCPEISIQNTLMDNFYYALDTGGTMTGENLTLHNGVYVVLGTSLTLKNSLMVDVDNGGGYTGFGAAHNVELSSATGVFQTVGDGNFYLANGSPYRDIGIDQIDPALKHELASMTTHPPSTTYSTLKTLTSDVTLAPDVPRDNDGNLDLGYHYPAIDHLIYHLIVDTGTTLTVEAGTQLASYGQYFVIVDDGGEAYFQGTVSNPISIGWARTVQGGTPASPNPYSITGNFHTFLPLDTGVLGAGAAVLHLSSVHVYAENYGTGGKHALYFPKTPGSPGGCSSLRIRDCLFSGLRFIMDDDLSGHEHDVVNNLFINSHFQIHDGQQSLKIFNNQMVNTKWDLNQIAGSSLWTIHDNVFDSMDASSQSTLTNTTSSHNAYHKTAFRVSGQPDTGDVVLQDDDLAHVTGPFGDYYQTSSANALLKNVGSRTAAAAGMFHYSSTWPNDVKEGSSTVDIGLHYPSTIPGSGGN